MMSTVCHRFVQNAWKKERCSNCFKSREEHITVKRETPVSRRPLSGTKSRGILKAAPGPGRRKRAVSFKTELAEVIGYGGEEWEDVSEFELSEESSAETSEDDSIVNGDDDKALEKLTKSNTELNANIAPATTTDRRRTFTQLMLGQPQKDAEGKKQTLLVSVTPFGQDEGDRTPTRRGAKSTVSHIPIAKNNKDLLVESRSKVVLTGYTKNRESPELLTKPGLEKKQQQQQQLQQTNVAEENKRETVSNKDSAVRREVTTQAAAKIDLTTVHKTNEQQSLTIHEQSTTQTVQTSTVLKTSEHKLKTTEELTQQINEIRQNTLDLLQRSTTTTTAASDVKQTARETKTEEFKASTALDSTKITNVCKQNLVEHSQKTLTSDSKQLKATDVGQETSDGATLLINGSSLRKECVVGDELKFDEDKCEVNEKVCIVETRNSECSVRKVECHSVSSTISAVERNSNITTTNNVSVAGEIANSNEPIVKSELSVQLRAPPVKRDLQVDVSGQQVENNSSSSEESADSLGPAESREQAGEPDGRADPDVLCEPPALPRSPPPLLAPPPRSSFLHGTSPRLTPTPASTPVGIGVEKPKVPCKPDKVAQMVRKPQLDLSPLPMLPVTPTLDPSKMPFKRRAPNPPPTPTLEDITGLPSEIFTPDSCDTIVIRSISMQEPDVISSTHIHEPILAPCPEPAPRKTVAASSDHIQLQVEKVDEKRKDKTRSRFSLKKFLRVGTSASKAAEKLKLEEIKEKNAPAPKPRLVIVHPLELNGSGVEVMAPPAGEDIHHIVQQPREVAPPAPPPRNIPEKRVDDPKPPPKSEETIRRQRQLSNASSSLSKASSANNNNVYANLGECRSGLAPSKPQRTASMREREALLEQQSRRLQLQKPEHVYERITPRRHSDEANSGNKEPRSFKCTAGGLNLYSGSEPDLELYAPCGSYYGSECEISEGSCSRPCRLRSRKGRSIVHRNLEDNYGAVVVANHEALAQVLEHLHLSPVVQPALRGLQSAPVLRWMDFSVVDSAPGVLVGRRAFHHALWGAHHITLVVCREQGSSMHKHPVGPGTNTLVPITEFSDLVPARYLPGNTSVTAESDLVQATVAVLPWIQVDTIQTLGASLKARNNQLTPATDANRDACFILLQFVNSLKSLQAQGIEEIPLSLSNFILCHEIDRDTHHRLCLLQGFSEEFSRPEGDQHVGSLCQCALAALNELFAASMLASLIHSLLRKESAMCLSQVKSILEFSLWGPADVAHGVPIKERELSLQRWLDLERATVLHGLVGTRVQLSVLEECHLLFLVRSSAKQMCEAALLLENNGGSS